MRATILADASYCPNTGAAGFGYWIASDRGKHGGGNQLRHADSSGVAEMMAIVNALWIARKSGLVEPGDHILIQTDCTAAIGALKGKRSSLTPSEKKVRKEFVRIIMYENLHVDFRHVKGHTSKRTHGEARFGANRACDGRARYHMEQARAARKGNGNETVPQN